MPLFADGLAKIRRNLIAVAAGEKPKLVRVGSFTDEQLENINNNRAAQRFEPLDSLIVFHGKHVYESRYINNGYSIEEVVEQISSAFSEKSIIVHSRSTCSATPHQEKTKMGKW